VRYLILVDDHYGPSVEVFETEAQRDAFLRKLLTENRIDTFTDPVFYIDETRSGGYDAYRPEVEE
jgi:hypothetical protein